jgi:hypothetical protein
LSQRAKVLTIVLFAVIVFLIGADASGPFVLRYKLRDDAHSAANAAEDAYFQSGSSETARSAALAVTDAHGSVLTNFQVLTSGAIRITVSDSSKSYFLDRFQPLRHYFEVEVSATAGPRAGPPPTSSTTKAG